nr:MAG TPA: hypothetical protein [Bacteriophage sp.]
MEGVSGFNPESAHSLFSGLICELTILCAVLFRPHAHS